MKNVVVQNYVEARVAEKAMTANEVLILLTEQARGSIEDFITIRGRGFSFDLKKAKDAGKLHLLRSVSKGPKGTRFEMYDAQKALELLGKASGALTERLDITSQGEKIELVIYMPGNGRETAGEQDRD